MFVYIKPLDVSYGYRIPRLTPQESDRTPVTL